MSGTLSAFPAPAPLTDRPLVSIIIITYNDLEYVGEAIDSALAQIYPNCEIIVVDDGSTDCTAQFVAERYGNRVRYRWKENGGQGSARSTGLQMASGEYIQNLDSDDLLLPDKIQNQISYLEGHPDVAFVYGRTLCFADNDRSHTWEHPANARGSCGNLLTEILRTGNFINVGQPLTRRFWVDRIGGFDPLIRDADDYDFVLRLAYAGASAQFLDEAVYLYRQRCKPCGSSQMSARHSALGQARGEVYLLGKLYSLMQRDGYSDLDLVKRSLGDASFQLGRLLFGEGKRREALHHMYQGVRLNRERCAYKMFVVAAAAFLPGSQLRALKRHLKAALRTLKDASRRYDD
jgi:glycosyltransferase involved in cell wall biosynthesis